MTPWNWVNERLRGTVSAVHVRVVALAATAVAIGVLWVPWSAPWLDRPEAGFAGAIGVGITEAPPDTRVFFHLEPWTEYAAASTLSIVLGQSSARAANEASFRIEMDVTGFEPVQDGRCSDREVEDVCWTGDGSVRRVSPDGELPQVLEGEFEPSGFLRIELTPYSLGDASNGPYRSLHTEILPLEDTGADFHYPARGVEVEIATGVGSDVVRYDSFFPSEPFRLYPDGWAWLVKGPGGPLGVQFTLIDEEQRYRRLSDVSGLFLGVFVALAVQITYEFVHRLAPTRRRDEVGSG